jgi:hypothetical protein
VSIDTNGGELSGAIAHRASATATLTLNSVTSGSLSVTTVGATVGRFFVNGVMSIASTGVLTIGGGTRPISLLSGTAISGTGELTFGNRVTLFCMLE